MPPEPFLHEHRDFPDLIAIVSRDRAVEPALVEKDYWIMHCLWGLQQRGFQFELKGGTSLSKAFGVIDRFSEDLDIRINPPAEMEVKTRRNHDKPVHVASRRKFFDWLAQEIVISGIVSVERDHGTDNHDLTSAGIRLHYDSVVDGSSDISEGVLLEVGFAEVHPNRPVDIASWALDRAQESGATFADNRAPEVRCYLPEYTFVEKLQAISTKFRQHQQQGTPNPSDFLRHYYDVYQLLDREDVQAFIGSPEFRSKKKRHFRASDNPNIAENEAFTMTDPAVRDLFSKEFEKTSALYYNGKPTFEEILARIAEHIDRL